MLKEPLTNSLTALVLRTHFGMLCRVLLDGIHLRKATQYNFDLDDEMYYRRRSAEFSDWSGDLVAERLPIFSRDVPLLEAGEIERFLLSAYGFHATDLRGEESISSMRGAMRVVIFELAPVVVRFLCPTDDARTFYQQLIGIVNRMARGTNHSIDDVLRTDFYDVVVRNAMKRSGYISLHEECVDALLSSVLLRAALDVLARRVEEHYAPRLVLRDGFISDLVFGYATFGLEESRNIVLQSIRNHADRIYENIP